MKSYLYIVLLLSLSCKGQFKNDPLLNKYVERVSGSFEKEKGLLKENVDINVVEYLPSGYSKLGDVNYTTYVQKALDKGGIVLMPNFPILIDSSSLFIKSNTKLIFDNGSKLIMKPNAETHYSLITIYEEKNIKIYSANLEGDRKEHLISKGEWGMGIKILGSENIKIFSPAVNNSWGDGIYIGGLGEVPSTSVEIYNPKINNSRRNGVSITAGKNILIKGGVITNTHGTAPQSGIDIEPNKPKNIINQIKLENITTYKNKGDGIMISLSHLTSKKGQVANKVQEANIQVLNHVDIKSHSGFRITGRLKGSDKYNDIKISGEILIKNPTWIGNNFPIRFSPKPDRILEYGFNPKVTLDNVLILDEKEQKTKNHEGVVDEVISKSKTL